MFNVRKLLTERQANKLKVRDTVAHIADAGNTILKVPGYSQTDAFSCGAIAGWSVVEALQPNAKSFADFYRTVNPSPRYGSGPIQVGRALKKFNVDFEDRRNMGFKDIAEAIESGFPILTLVQHPESWDCDHWIVVVGIRRHPKTIYITGMPNPGDSTYEYTWSEWRKHWATPSRGAVCWGV